MDFNNDTGQITSLLTIDTTTASPLNTATNILSITGTGALVLPVGNATTERPTAANGMIRYNNVANGLEFYNGAWVSIGSGTGSVTSVAATGSTGLTVGGSPITTSGTLTFTLGTELQGLSALSANGVTVRTAAGTYASRTVTGTASNISVTNGDGVAGNPTIDLATVTQASSGNFVKVTLDTKGRVTGNTAVLSSDITSALTYTPVNKAGDTMTNNATLTFSGTGTVTGLATPSAASDAATKSYVDNLAQGLDPKASVRAATAAAGTLATSFANASVVDGITLATGDRILIKNQAAGAENGIYIVAASGAPARAADMSVWTEVPNGYVFVEEGSTLADTGWVCTSNAGGTLNSTAITWVQFSGAGTYTAGTGLTLTGTQFAITSPIAATIGGTGLTAYGTANQILGMNNGATALEYKSFAGTANQITATNAANALTFSIPTAFTAPGSVTVTTGLYQSTNAAVTAGTNTQGQGALTTSYNVVTTTTANPSGVTLPAAGAGWAVTVINKGTNPISLFPATGAAIDGAGANTAITLPVGTSITVQAASATQWYVNEPINAAGTGLSITNTNGIQTYTNTGVTSITGTANQITASASTGGVTLSLPGAVTLATSLTVTALTANSFIYSGTAGLLTATAAPTNGQLLIGSTGAAPVLATLTPGTGISVTNAAGSITIANTGLISITGTANQITVTGTTTPTLSIPTTFTAPGSVTVTTGLYQSTTAAVTAGTNAQGQGALTSSYNVITTTAANPSGVTLPTAVTGWAVTVVNKGTNPVSVFPATGAAIDGAGANVAITLPVGASLTVQASSATQWYDTGSIELAGTGMSVTYGNGTVTYNNTGVTSVALSAPSIFTVTGSPVTTTGTLTFALNTQTTNLVFASPNGSTGAPTFRSLAMADLPIKLYAENSSTPTAPAAAGTNAVASGSGASSYLYGGKVHSGGMFVTAGDAQSGMYIARAITTTATAAELFLDGSGAAQRLVLPNNSLWTFKILVAARRTDATGGGAGYSFEGIIRRDSGVATTTLTGTPSKVVLGETNTPWDIAISADTTNGSLKLLVTGEAAKTIRWVATVITTEVTN